MTSDFCGNDGAGSFVEVNSGVCSTSGDFHNYYSWTANATNDYDIWAKWQVPKDFSDWDSTPIQFFGWRTSSSAGTTVTMTLYSNSGVVCGTATNISNTTTWTATSYTTTGCNPAAGDIMFFDIHLSVGVNGEFARVGEITINYLSKF
jgi:hypothetical protein